jgi:hypothetical protein
MLTRSHILDWPALIRCGIHPARLLVLNGVVYVCHASMNGGWPRQVWAQLLAASVEHEHTHDDDLLLTRCLTTLIPGLGWETADLLPRAVGQALLLELGLNTT